MDDERNCKLKISVANLDSEDDSDSSFSFSSSSSSSSSSSEGEEESKGVKGKETGRRRNGPPRSRQSSSDDENHSTDHDSDKDVVSVSAVDSESSKLAKQKVKTYKNEGGTFVVGFDVTSEDCQNRQKLRAKRFGEAASSVTVVTDEAIQKLYESLGVSPPSDDEENDGVRFDAIHIRGVDEMSTSRVFSYFGEFAPSAIEWIDDTSCNVVWKDKIMVVRALLKLSYDPASSLVSSSVAEEKNDKINDDITPAADLPEADSKDVEIEDDDDLNLMSDDDDDVAKLSHSTITAEENRTEVRNHRLSSTRSISKLERSGREEEEDVEVEETVVTKEQTRSASQPSIEKKVFTQKKKIQKIHINENSNTMPPGKWRLGVPHTRSKHLFMRFATKDDVKQRGAGKRSKYYQKYGNPNFGGIKGIISESRKRKMFSMEYQAELEEARKAIEEAKWKRGIPDETKFDQHQEEVVLKREITKKKPATFNHSSDESRGSSDGLVVEPVNVPKKKRFMKMYADEVEERSISNRLGSSHSQSSKSSVWDRLGGGVRSLRSADSKHHYRNDRGDLRSRLNQR